MVKIIEAKDILLIKSRKKILDIGRFALQRGEITALIGPNGAGKTSLLLTLALLQRPTRGTILFEGKPAGSQNALSLRRQMAVVFQEPLLMNTTVWGNVMTGLRLRGIPSQAARQRVEEWLERLGIAHLKQRPALQLSGGEAQRVNLARAFALQPKVIFLDEPFSGLDYPTRISLLNELGKILQETGVTALFVTHDYTEMLHLARRATLIMDGRIIISGTVEEVSSRYAALARHSSFSAHWETVRNTHHGKLRS